MQKFLTIILMILLYSCGGDEPTSPQIIDYYSEDNQFLEELSISNGKSVEYFSDFIENVLFDSSGYKSYRIKKMYLDDKGLDSLPVSIRNLDSLTILILNNNNIQYIAESICDVYGQLDILEIDNNNICTPTIPECIERNTTITKFYGDQGCDILPDEGDRDFILDLITLNWADTTTEFINILKNSYTEWEVYWEVGNLVSRITEIRYDDKAITKIPNSIGDLDSLRWLELQNNQITVIPGYIGNLKKLQDFIISQNNITVLPPQIGDLVNLEVLKIDFNNLNDITSNISSLQLLHTLWLSDNQLTTLPIGTCDETCHGMCDILGNSNIYINIDNNLLCWETNDSCFEDLIMNHSTQPPNICD